MAGLVLQPIIESITNPLEAAITSTAGNVATAITPTASTLLMIYIIFWAWSYARGVIKEPILDATGRLIKLILIYTIALSATHYAQFVIEFFWKSPDAMAALIVADPMFQTSGGVANFLDQMMLAYSTYSQVFADAADADKSYGIPNLRYMLMSWAIMIFGVINVGIGTFFYLLAKVALAVLLGIGAIFIIALFFEATRKYFEAWVGQLANYMLVAVLIASVLSLVAVEIFNQTRLAIHAACPVVPCTQEPSLEGGWLVIVLSVICIFFYFLIPGIASALGGGVALSSLGFIGGVWRRTTGMARRAGAGGWREVSGRGVRERRARRVTNARMKAAAQRYPSMTTRAMRAGGRTVSRLTGSGTNTVKRS